MSDVMSGTLLRDREHLEPSDRYLRSKADGVEEVSPARRNPRFGYERARSERVCVVRIDGKVIQDLVDNILRGSGSDDRCAFNGRGVYCFRGFRTHLRSRVG